jgi:hypothetical protein
VGKGGAAAGSVGTCLSLISQLINAIGVPSNASKDRNVRRDITDSFKGVTKQVQLN